MYKLVCADKNNSKIFSDSFKNTKIFEEIRQKATIENISDYIFNNTLNEKQLGNIVAALTLGDELRRPFNENTANILFFAVCSNYFTKDVEKRIKWFPQAKELYKMYDNNYIDYINPSIKDNQIYSTLKWNYNLALESFLEFKIPIVYFTYAENKYCTISSKSSFNIRLNSGEEFRVPRKKIMSMFTNEHNKGKIVGQDPDQINEMFNYKNISQISEILIDIGFRKLIDLNDDYLEPSKKVYSYQHGKLLYRYIDVDDYIEAKRNKNIFNAYWKEINNNCFVLCPKFPYLLWGDFENGNCQVLIKK